MARSSRPDWSSRSKKAQPEAKEKSNPFRHEQRAEKGTSAPLHRPVARMAVEALVSTLIDGRYADKVIEFAFKNEKSMGSRDRRQFAEMVYDLVRWYRRFAYAVGFDTESGPPDKAVLWKCLGAFIIERAVKNGGVPSLPTWGEFDGLDANDIATRLSQLDDNRAVRESIPDWLDELGERELGSDWDKILRASNTQAPAVLRANSLKCTREQLIKRLQEEDGIHAVPAHGTRHGLLLKERRNVFTTAAYKDGWFEMQDGASQMVADLVEAQPGERVIDACAGAGGKTLSIGADMKNKGRLLSLDVHEKKLQELRRRVARSGIDTNEAKLIDSAKVIKRLEGTADKVLLDVPCSGLGVLRRNPDKKWKFTPEELANLQALQAQILDEYSLLAKPGGLVIYATCSCLPSENREQVNAFIERSKKTTRPFTLIKDRTYDPGENNYDGFYAALLK